jgi:hypothetical protein
VSICSSFIFILDNPLAYRAPLPSRTSAFSFFLKLTQILIVKIIKKSCIVSFFVRSRAGTPALWCSSSPFCVPSKFVWSYNLHAMTHFVFNLLSFLIQTFILNNLHFIVLVILYHFHHLHLLLTLLCWSCSICVGFIQGATCFCLLLPLPTLTVFF